MFIVWRGYGWLTPVIAIFGLFVSLFMIKAIAGSYFETSSRVPFAISVVFASLLLGFVGYSVNKKRKRYTDTETGEEVTSPSHTFFFIPMQYWGVIIPLVLFSGKLIGDSSEAEDLIAIEQAAIGDRYHIVLPEVLAQDDTKFKYSLMKIVAFSDEGYEFVIAGTSYRKRKHVRHAVRDKDDVKADFYFDNRYSFTQQELISLRKSGGIYNIESIRLTQ